MRIRDQVFGPALPHFLMNVQFCEGLKIFLEVPPPANAGRFPGM